MIDTPDHKRAALAAILSATPGTDCPTQRRRIRAALSQFSITTFEAMRYLDVYDPRKRVSELRRDGDPIDTHWHTIHTEAGVRHRVGLYTLTPSINHSGVTA